MAGCGLFRDDTAPEPLVGVWVTDAPRYAGTSLEITPKRVVFNTVDQQTRVNFIVDIEKETKGDEVLYDILYKDGQGLEYTLSITLRKTGGGKVLQFRNQTNMEWRPAGRSDG